MEQIIHFDDQLKERVLEMEFACENLCKTLQEKFQPNFDLHGIKLILELIRSKKGKRLPPGACFEDDYESVIEIGVEQEDDYYPNGYIPLWKCKEEWFQKTGYLTDKNLIEIGRMIEAMVIEILEDQESAQLEGE
ncbi:hypothetical protein D1B31_06395 [Neobacillus notoginsengisoli]|uniref:Uncharacterized protein n=1 Tax=Neobacillus notoginsengisoli TaxID=1578198 RepID=A0A417YXN6_9BACI|nr:hypothetical protein [Neobacillus notoginsengisoli]RHW42250.1 hypothetical protein D1B31_06395 [Neobacillus notoginsengisoli]